MIIGLSGYARSGKDTVAQYLVENYGYERIAFADPIKNLLLEMNPILYNGGRLSSLVRDYGWDVAKANSEVRRLLQSLGLGARTVLNEDIWVSNAMLNMMDITKNYVVTDVRFKNEAEMIKSLYGEVWRVKRIGVDAVNSHVSESELDGWKFDQIIANAGTIDELQFLINIRMRSYA
jgi:adenosyl cobinamide kinase/adenosyl cobinamide phosphate guanylyltransferase